MLFIGLVLCQIWMVLTNPTMTINFDDNHSSVGLTLHFSEDFPLEMI